MMKNYFEGLPLESFYEFKWGEKWSVGYQRNFRSLNIFYIDRVGSVHIPGELGVRGMHLGYPRSMSVDTVNGDLLEEGPRKAEVIARVKAAYKAKGRLLDLG